MKKNLIWPLLAVSFILLVSCNKDTTVFSFSMAATDVALTRAGGQFSGSFSISKAPDGATLTFVSDMDWISDVTYSVIGSGDITYGTYKFTAEENDGTDVRSGTITVTYTCPDDIIVNTVSVTQAAKSYCNEDFTVSDLVGTYTAYGREMTSTGSFSSTTWTLIILEKDERSVYIDGLVPSSAGLYINEFGGVDVSYLAVATLNDDKELVIESGMTPAGVLTAEGYGNYYCGYTPCTQSNPGTGTGYYSSDFPPLTFACNGDVQSWRSDYGVFFVGCTSTSIDTLFLNLGTVIPTISILKESDEVPSVSQSAAKVLSGLKIRPMSSPAIE